MKRTVAALLMLVFLAAAAPVPAETESFWINGYKYYPLYSICHKKDIIYCWDSVGRVVTLRKDGVEAKIRAGSDKILINNGKLEDIGSPIYFYEGSIIVPVSFANKKLDTIFRHTSASYKKKSSYVPANTIKTIVLDPGHGGKDPGAISKYYRLKEKDINLDIAVRLKRLLASSGMKVYLTRERDVFIPLWKRAEFANKKRADLFISVHANASRSSHLRGFEVYYLSEKADDNARAKKAADKNAVSILGNVSIDRRNATARAIACDLYFTENRIESKELSKQLLSHAKNRSIYIRPDSLRSARFHVLNDIKTDMPAILVEVGYLSNKKDEGFLKMSGYRDRIANALADGILSYKAEYEKTNGFTR